MTSDLAGPDYEDGKALLVLYPMSSSDMSTQCMIALIDGRNVREMQSPRLTTEYLIPSGSHTYGFACEESVGSIPIRDYSFYLTFDTVAGGRYGLLRQPQRKGAACILVQNLGKDTESPVGEYCPP